MTENPEGFLSTESGVTEEDGDRLLELIEIGIKSKSVEVFGHRVIMKTMTVDDELRVSEAIGTHFRTAGENRAFKTAVVAACLSEIDGRPFYTPLTLSEPENNVLAKFDKLREYHPVVVDELYKEFVEFEKETAEFLRDKLGKSDG